MNREVKEFYDRQFLREDINHPMSPQDHDFSRELLGLIEKYGLKDKRCLEVGCGRGAFQDLVEDYTGTDLAEAVGPYLHKPFCQTCVTRLPFKDNEFDALWTIDTLEHLPEPQKALEEMRRVLKPGGVLILKAAWYCRQWAAEGYPVRPYSDFGWGGKLIKASIPLRNTVAWRAFFILPRRLLRLLQWGCSRRPLKLAYKPLKPNLEVYWMPDSDAAVWLDPFEVILWFISRGDSCLTYPGRLAQIFIRTGALVFSIKKPRGND